MELNRKIFAVIVAVSILVGAGGMYMGLQVAAGDNALPVMEQTKDADDETTFEQALLESTNADSLQNIDKAFDMIRGQYFEEVDEQALIDGAISGMVETLDDPYSDFMDEDTAQQFMQSLDSHFQGIGAEVSMMDGYVTIMSPFRDSPAEDAGLRPNDRILKIDGESVEGLSLHDAVLQIRGEKGSTVTLTIDRPGVSGEMEYDVVRDEIPIETVHSEVIREEGKTIGKLELTSFSENTAEDFGDRLQQLESEGIDGLIIDVRGNPGGYLQSVEDIGDMIIPGGETIVQIADREGGVIQEVSELEEEKTYPIVTVIDEGSASASEILAAALKEAGGQEVVGKPSFGKGTVQQALQLGDGSELKLSVFKWLTSDGNFINEVGVEPTVEAQQPEFFYLSPLALNEDEQLEFDMNDEKVETAQLMLEATGYDPGRTDGYFNEETEAAVRSFQEDEGLEVNGVIGEKTAAQLHDLIIEAIQDPAHDKQMKTAVDVLFDALE
ncbi:S41 family peptidase [Texcoconibacillus texcoconensis]|uniref:Carboxyl-terminal processing protease n=1 Tax=Texcoconibacillus texcoconensis TaxID=1095777 RepID=A0A840QQ07_9BACI|nr:S41 family peptidase [Texcoconibacillus texcoconensis]MBB5173428.1 carboxyl-terminal processing protease [Texcoconibacillus texcoconensis]